jgi:alpha-N-arabinofuranosidase
MKSKVYIESNRIIGHRDAKIYGQFIEHFHNQIYGGIYDPSSPFSDEHGIRKDVVQAIEQINPQIVRWPGGCFVSAYDWENGIGPIRQPHFDKAWRVEESNEFGTDEFIALCRKINAEPYICTNAGSGTPEEMSNWVEYCNLRTEGKWAKKRIANGHREPHNVKYWSIGNENYLPGEIGAKTSAEWGRFVKESAKMMKRVDPKIQLLAASVPDIDWNINLLREAGQYLDWISIHGYWDSLWQKNDLSPYETCMTYTLTIEEQILKTKYILGVFGYLGKIRIAFDEWNLRGWHHPHVDSATEDYITPRDKNDINSSYTMADAVFSACFLNQCLKHSDVIGMANFAPTVNTRGAIYAHKDGIVLRSTYFVFELYTQLMGDAVLDSWISENSTFKAANEHGEMVQVPSLDIVATKSSDTNDLRISIVNRHPEKPVTLNLAVNDLLQYSSAKLYGITASSKDSYNDLHQPDEVKRFKKDIMIDNNNDLELEINPHSVNVLVFTY